MKKYSLIIFFFINTALIFSKMILLNVADMEINIPLEGVKIYSNEYDIISFTDEYGKAEISIEDNINYMVIKLELIGYQNKTIMIDQFDKEIIIGMSISSVIEDKELVIEENRIISNEELGVSDMLDKNQIDSAMSGMVEDVMSAIKLLPGVSYGAGMGGNNLSVRGGDTDGLTTVLDGFIVRYPYQWNNMYSIFSPSVVESVKFSAGIFSAKYGLAASAIMEVNSITPDEGLKLMTLLSLADSEFYLQTSLWKNSGLLIGGRFIYYDVVNLMMGGAARGLGTSLNLNSQYLRDGYFKWFWKPHDRLEWYINGFFGCDGINMNMDAEGNDIEGISNKYNMSYYNIDTFWNNGFKILPNDKLFIHFFTGYECLINESNGSSGYQGTQDYSDQFIEYYEDLMLTNPSLPGISGIKSFTLDLDSEMYSRQVLHSLQTRGDFDVTLHEKVLLSTGGGGIFDFYESSSNGLRWQFVMDDGIPVYKKTEYESVDENKQLLKTFIYLSFDFNIIPGKLRIETGCRIDHNLIFGPDYHLNTYPVPGPRFDLTFTPVRNLRYLDSLSFSIGTGLFSKSPDISNINGDMGLNHFDITIPRTLTTVIGTELKFPIGLSFKLEGYYKYTFDRYYINTVNSNGTNDFIVHKDGIGHAAGFDLSIEKTISRWIDGSISYSFIYARLLNPQTDGSSGNESMGGEPTGSWFYPSYHKFHNFNIILNIRPVKWCTITPKFVLSSGAPASQSSVEQSYAVMDNNQVAEMYSISSEYNDSLRDDLSFQFDLKVSFSSFFPMTKIKWELFISVENLFVFLYSPSGGGAVNQFTGEDQSSSDANYSAQVPIPNVGLKINF